MCGIAGTVGAGGDLEAALDALAHRGPDARGTAEESGVRLGHARLAILDLDPRSNQPFRRGRVLLSYNGELWNYRPLREQLAAEGEEFSTTGDTEVVAAALDRWGPSALERMNGMFALAWTTGDGTAHLARDRFGEVPLHAARSGEGWAFASEVKALPALGADPLAAALVEPGTVATLGPGWNGLRRWYDAPTAPAPDGPEEAAERLRALIETGCRERAISDVPACVLISGGIDSSALAYHLRDHLPGLVAYVATLDPRSRDLRCAREVAEALGAELVEVAIRPPDAEDLARTAAAIEMPFKAQVEIAWACLELARRMRADGFRVTFSGEGSDELWASYGFAYWALDRKGEDWHGYRKRLFLDQHRKNFARANKAFLASGVECRLPFLHPSLVEYALSLTRDAVQDGRARPKAVIQRAYAGLLPESVTRRPKLAFQDGLGLKKAAARAVADPRRFYRSALAESLSGPR